VKEQLTVRLDPEVLKAARAKAQRDNVSVSAVVAEAAGRALLHAGHAEWEAGIVRALDRVGAKVEKLDKRTRFDAGVLKEMLGLLVRAYFNHTPAIPEPALRPALLSGKERFARFMDTLATNLGRGHSVLRDVASPPDPVEERAAVPEAHPPSPAEAPLPPEPENLLPSAAPDPPEMPAAPADAPAAPPVSASVVTHDPVEPAPPAPAKRRWGLF
jgi:hypothetical protein